MTRSMSRNGARCGRMRRMRSTSNVVPAGGPPAPPGLLGRSATATAARGWAFGRLRLGGPCPARPAGAAGPAGASGAAGGLAFSAFAGVVALDDAVGEIEVGRRPHHAGLVPLEDHRVAVGLTHPAEDAFHPFQNDFGQLAFL